MGIFDWLRRKPDPQIEELQGVLSGFAEYCERVGINYVYRHENKKVKIVLIPPTKGVGEYLTTYYSSTLRDFLHAVDILESVLGDIEIRQTSTQLEAIIEIGG